jgi:hypothetical protein
MDKNIRMILVELRSSIFPPESVDFPMNSPGDRIDQIESGIINFVEKLGEISKKDNIDLYFSDNTIIDDFHIPEKISKLLKLNSINTSCKIKNDFGPKNKGAGLIEMWLSNIEIIEKYKWIIYFEPRTLLKDKFFIEECLEFPDNRFKVLNENGNLHFYTGLFMIESKILIEFCRSVDINDMINKKICIEKSLKDFMDTRYPNYSKYENKLNIIWHDVTQNRFIEF